MDFCWTECTINGMAFRGPYIYKYIYRVAHEMSYHFMCYIYNQSYDISCATLCIYTGWRTKCRTILCVICKINGMIFRAPPCIYIQGGARNVIQFYVLYVQSMVGHFVCHPVYIYEFILINNLWEYGLNVHYVAQGGARLQVTVKMLTKVTTQRNSNYKTGYRTLDKCFSTSG